jgi:hypothetical protein
MEIQPARRHPVAAAMAREEDDLLAVKFAEQQFVRRHAKGRDYLFPFRLREPVDIVNAAAANHANDRRCTGMCHSVSP